MAWIATTFIIFHQTHSVLSTSFPSICFFVPAVLLGPLSTRLSSRFGAAKIFIFSETAVGLVTVLPAAMAMVGKLHMVTLLIWEFAQGSAIGLQGPSKNMLIRNLAPLAKVPEYNSKILRSVAISAVIGFLAGGALLDIFGPLWTFIINALSSLALATVVLPRFHDRTHNLEHETMSLAFPVLRKSPGLRSAFLMFATVTLVGSIVVLFPSIADHLGKGASGVSILNMAFVFGGLFIVGSIRFLHQRVKWSAVIWVGMVMMLFFLIFLVMSYYASLTHTLSLILVGLVLLPLGFLVSLQTSILTALVQVSSQKESETSILELFALLPMIIIPVSEALIGLLSDKFSINIALMSVGATLLGVFIWGILTHQKQSLAEINQQEIVTPLNLMTALRGTIRPQRGESTTR
jgi:MFS family permease